MIAVRRLADAICRVSSAVERVLGKDEAVGSAPTLGSGAWRSLVARGVRDAEAVGSNPAAPTGLFPPRLTAGLQTLTLCIVVRIHGRERTPLQMEEELFQAVHGLEWIWKHRLLANARCLQTEF